MIGLQTNLERVENPKNEQHRIGQCNDDNFIKIDLWELRGGIFTRPLLKGPVFELSQILASTLETQNKAVRSPLFVPKSTNGKQGTCFGSFLKISVFRVSTVS